MSKENEVTSRVKWLAETYDGEPVYHYATITRRWGGEGGELWADILYSEEGDARGWFVPKWEAEAEETQDRDPVELFRQELEGEVGHALHPDGREVLSGNLSVTSTVVYRFSHSVDCGCGWADEEEAEQEALAAQGIADAEAEARARAEWEHDQDEKSRHLEDPDPEPDEEPK